MVTILLATLNGEDYSSKVVTSGTVDASKAGLYYITYTATNAVHPD